MQKSPPGRRRYPRARADLRFRPARSGLALADAQGRRTGPLSLLAAGDAATVRADVERALDRFAHEGMLD